jgi:ATP-dependent Lon protease
MQKSGNCRNLKKQPVRNATAMKGEITVMGKVLAVGGIQQKIRAAYDAGVKEVLLPAENLKETQELPSYILATMKLIPLQTVDEAFRYALIGVASLSGSRISAYTKLSLQ